MKDLYNLEITFTNGVKMIVEIIANNDIQAIEKVKKIYKNEINNVELI